MWADKDKQTSSAYDTKDKENTLGMYKNKEKALDGYVCICECGKHFWHSTY